MNYAAIHVNRELISHQELQRHRQLEVREKVAEVVEEVKDHLVEVELANLEELESVEQQLHVQTNSLHVHNMLKTIIVIEILSMVS